MIILTIITSRNQPKCNHSIYMRLVVVCNYIWEYLQLQDQISTILVIFITMMQLLKLVGLILHLFLSINRLICPIMHNSHQIGCLLKVFYNDIHVYFDVCTKIIYIHMYIVHIMNLKTNI